MARTTKSTAKQDIEIVRLERGKVTLHLLGVTPLVYNAMSFKTKVALLKPSGRKTKAERQVTLKHNPHEEYVDSTYRRRASVAGPTRLLMPSRSFKAAISDVAKRIPGAPPTTEVKQLTYVQGDYVDVYGLPQIFLCAVRNSDINRTPDIRTRAIVPEWCCTIVVDYSQPLITSDAVAKLVYAAGQINGVGDFRQQKGAGNYGQFVPVTTAEERKEFDRIMKYGTMAAQDDALLNEVPYDQESEEMLSWFDAEVAKRDNTNVTEIGGEDDFYEDEGNGVDNEAIAEAEVEAAVARRVPRVRI